MLNNINECLFRDVEKILGKGKFSISQNISPIAIAIDVGGLIPLLKMLRDNDLYGFTVLVDLFAVDYPSKNSRFEINYNLLSMKHNYRLVIKIDVEEKNMVPSVVQIFSSAAWLEREVWDMYGIKFKGNQDLRRILTDYGFEGHPLRKDFPLTGYKELRYDLEKHKVAYQDVALTQEYRSFDFESPWEGAQYKLNKYCDEDSGEDIKNTHMSSK